MAKAKVDARAKSIPIVLLRSKEWKEWIKKQTPEIVSWAQANNFTAMAGIHCLVPGSKGNISHVLAGVAETLDIWSIAALPDALPVGHYHIETPLDANTADTLMLGWLLGSYQFTRYIKKIKTFATLQPPAKCNLALVQSTAEALNNARDLINTPPNDMGPAELAAACGKVAATYKAEYQEIIGENLIKQNYPAVYAVGKASTRAPRLVDIRWGDKRHPKVTLIGKGVCFDTGGLDIKTSAGMKLMKKDMGGAACVLALAHIIMASSLPVRLRVLIPAVENSISGNAYRTSDIINTRKGITVEVGNTDAEGRLILADALFEATQEKPDLLIDCATLTGAARVALGTDVPALFTPHTAIARDILRHSEATHDPMWRLPLWQGYRDMLKSQIADINSAPDSSYAGAITAALFLREFVEETTPWVHIDMMAWNLSKRSGRPVGGEAMAVRALFATIRERFSVTVSKR